MRTAAPDADILVVDDNSPDGTGDIAEKTAAELGRVDVLHRPGKEGLGAAYREGFRWGLDHGYDVIVQMDCDFSHDPAVIPTAARRSMAEGVDCAIGSRYVPGGSTPGWPLHRRMLSRYGNRYTAAVLAPRHQATPPAGSGPTGPPRSRPSTSTAPGPTGTPSRARWPCAWSSADLRLRGDPDHVRRPGVRHVEDVGARSWPSRWPG